MIQELHHIGIAVRSVDDALSRYVDELGLRLESREEVAEEQAVVAVLRAGDTRIELLEPTAPDSPVARFLDKRGPGVHHLAFRVADTGGVVRVLTEAGAQSVDVEETPRAEPSAGDFLVRVVFPSGPEDDPS